MKFEVYDTKGKKTDKKVDLNDEVFGITPNDHAIYLDVKRYLAHQRKGTSKAKERGELQGSTKKIKRQKGTGTARSGDIKSPIFRGGGTVFGPRPKKYRVGLNKKMRKLARNSALSYKAKNKELTVLKDVEMKEPKTREFAGILDNLKASGRKVLFVVPEKDDNLILSSRNIPGSKVVLISDLNTYDIMNADQVIFTEGSLDKVDNFKK